MTGSFYFVSLRVVVRLWQGNGIKTKGNNPFGSFPLYFMCHGLRFPFSVLIYLLAVFDVSLGSSQTCNWYAEW